MNELRDEAEERFPDGEWYITRREFADGDTIQAAFHTAQVLDDNIVIQDRLRKVDGEFVETRHVISTREYIAKIDEGEPGYDL